MNKPTWQEEYCKKFGLCENQPKFSKCRCLKEIRFIKNLIKEAYLEGFNEGMDEVRSLYD